MKILQIPPPLYDADSIQSSFDTYSSGIQNVGGENKRRLKSPSTRRRRSSSRNRVRKERQ